MVFIWLFHHEFGVSMQIMDKYVIVALQNAKGFLPVAIQNIYANLNPVKCKSTFLSWNGGHFLAVYVNF